MPRDNQSKLSKKEQIKRSKKQEELNKKKKKVENSDSDNNDDISETESEEMDVHEFRKYVQKIFPSKHLDNKIKAGEKVKKIMSKVENKNNKKTTTNSEDEDE